MTKISIYNHPSWLPFATKSSENRVYIYCLKSIPPTLLPFKFNPSQGSLPLISAENVLITVPSDDPAILMSYEPEPPDPRPRPTLHPPSCDFWDASVSWATVFLPLISVTHDYKGPP